MVFIYAYVPDQLGFPGGTVVKNLPADAGDAAGSLGQEDPLAEAMAAHSSILAGGKLRGPRNLAGCSPWGHKRVRHD